MGLYVVKSFSALVNGKVDYDQESEGEGMEISRCL